MRYAGRCHCGNLSVTFDASQNAGRLPLRKCGCTFCRRHGATRVTDPAGSLEVRIADAELISRYRFGLETSELLICRRCGVHVAAVCVIDGATYASLNCNVLDERAAFTQPALPVDYDEENVADRLARRRRAWTPASVR
ncbi:MAG TPA: hypothetical protein VIV57_26980 [Anaeromyxobacter sp.]